MASAVATRYGSGYWRRHLSAKYPLTRRPGDAFDCYQVERFVQERAAGHSVPVSADRAGVSRSTGLSFEAEEAVRERLRELRAGTQTTCTVSLAWICEQLKKNAVDSREGEEPNFKASNEALKLLYEIVTDPKNDPKLSGLGTGLPMDGPALQDELRKRLSRGPDPIHVQAEARDAETAP